MARHQSFPLERQKMCSQQILFNLLYYAQPRGLPHQHLGIKLHCKNHLEPIGGSKPKFSNEDTKNILGHNSVSIGLLCSAQGSPTPTFRYANNVLSSYRTNWWICSTVFVRWHSDCQSQFWFCFCIKLSSSRITYTRLQVCVWLLSKIISFPRSLFQFLSIASFPNGWVIFIFLLWNYMLRHWPKPAFNNQIAPL